MTLWRRIDSFLEFINLFTKLIVFLIDKSQAYGFPLALNFLYKAISCAVILWFVIQYTLVFLISLSLHSFEFFFPYWIVHIINVYYSWLHAVMLALLPYIWTFILSVWFIKSRSTANWILISLPFELIWRYSAIISTTLGIWDSVSFKRWRA